jgi:4-amino-4-deoxy-L-arabinose transferase-like glycosyltransferase
MDQLDWFLENFDEQEEVSSELPYWILFLAPLAAFFLTWFWKADNDFIFQLAYSVLAALAGIVLTLVIFVWIPNDQLRKINRKLRFEKSEMLIEKCRLVLKNIKENNAKDREVKENGASAIATIQELVRLLKLKTSYQGIVEDNLVPGLFDYLIQLYAWYKDQLMAKALDSDKKDKLYNFLTKKDDLFQSWQSSGIDPMPYLTSSFRSENHMLSAGIITNEKE